MKCAIIFILIVCAGYGQKPITGNSPGGGTASSVPASGVTGITTNVVPKGTGGGLGNSSVTDNGTTMSTTEPISAPSISTGTGPTCTAGTGGASCSGEGTAPSVGPASGVDVCYADSTSHKILCSWNNGSYFPITQVIASGATALGTGAISSASCATVVTATATGTLSTDAISWTPNGSIKAVTGYVPATTGGLTISAYPGSGAVNFDVCNWTSGSITPGAITINWRVTR